VFKNSELKKKKMVTLIWLRCKSREIRTNEEILLKMFSAQS